jgi:hypothetical protein
MSAVPVQKPIIVTRPKPQLRVEQGIRPSVVSKAFANVVVFSALSLSFFFSSSLAGQVMVEKARREGLSSTQRAKLAVKEESLLRERVQSITRASAIAAWAEQNHFIPPEELVADATSSDSSHVTPGAQTDKEK